LNDFLSYLDDNSSEILQLLREHIFLAIIPIVLGLAIALPLGWLASARPRLATPLLAITGVLYTIPSLAVFLLLPPILGTGILDRVNIVVALTIYTVALLLRSVIDGLSSVPEHVRIAAIALGYGPFRRLVGVDLPIAVPVIMAGLRVATVANVSLVSVGALIGVGGLGELFTRGFQIGDTNPIIAGVVLSVLLALTADAVLVLLQWTATPWTRLGRAR
jgi:osmoprotectant transport system permease protein